MVCNETYKDTNNNWIRPDEVVNIEGVKCLKKDKSIKVTIGASESMSKSKKNTIDPEDIILNYGADSARLFILSDSPPEKDVQWSDEGITSAYKFIQKLWNLNSKILDEMSKDHKNDHDNELTKYTNRIIKKITENLENFSYNKIVANFHELHSFFSKQIMNSYKKSTLKENYSKILITMTPVIPHFSNECLKLINAKSFKWPSYDEKDIKEDIINIVIQINGKKRSLISTKPDISEEDLMELINKDEKLFKYFNGKEIKRKIFIKNKLINIII